MPRRHQLEQTVARLGALIVTAVACAACTPAPPRADSTASAATTAASPPAASPPAATPRDTGGADTTPARPRLVPRPPHPVPMPMPPRDTLTAPTGGDEDADRRAIEQLRRETRALAHTEGCAAAGQCAVLPLGERACGGPEEYLVYCPRSTDVAALTRKADALAAAQRAFNAKYGVASTCDMRLPPTAALTGGRCAPAPTAPTLDR